MRERGRTSKLICTRQEDSRRKLLYATMWLGRTPVQPQTGFDVATIKPDRSGSGSTTMRTSHGRLTASNVTVRMLKQFQISRGPDDWADAGSGPLRVLKRTGVPRFSGNAVNQGMLY